MGQGDVETTKRQIRPEAQRNPPTPQKKGNLLAPLLKKWANMGKRSKGPKVDSLGASETLGTPRFERARPSQLTAQPLRREIGRELSASPPAPNLKIRDTSPLVTVAIVGM